MRTLSQIEKLTKAGRLEISEAVTYLHENDMQDQLPVVEDYCEVSSSGRSQNVNYGDFTSSGEIIDWHNERRNFYRNAKPNEEGELEVKIYHSNFINWNGESFETISLFDTIKESNLA